MYTGDGRTTAAVLGDQVMALPAVDPLIPADMAELLAGGEPLLERVRRAIAHGGDQLPLADVRLAAPVPAPQKFLAVGLNYAEHAAEGGADVPEVPAVFAKLSNTVAGPVDDVHLPRVSTMLDFEGELGIVIGRRCRHVSREDAPAVIAGYVVVNDLSVRDWQWRTPQWVVGKSFDTHGPFGPWLTTADEFGGDPHTLTVRTWVNGDLRQESSTSHLIRDCFELVEHLSQACTLEPGDVIATGTPAGVGAASEPPRWLSVGDVVRVEIEGIGAIENTVVAEPQAQHVVGVADSAEA
jgi:2-keto-4-pentenoate hydratase/2-oxohepta-3-ene-1,7-dioic acid hydratase in catechol pathway